MYPVPSDANALYWDFSVACYVFAAEACVECYVYMCSAFRKPLFTVFSSAQRYP